jgi:hypothetical protein
MLSVECMFRRSMEMKLEWSEYLWFVCVLIGQIEIGTNGLQKSGDDRALLVINHCIILK